MAGPPRDKFPLPRGIEKEIPLRAGSNMQTKYVFGHNPREQSYTSQEGVRGIPSFGTKRKPIPGGTHSSTAPLKTEIQHFTNKHGFPNLGGIGGR